MVRKSSRKEARVHIERAIRECEGMPEVRVHLVGALRKIDEKERKSEPKNGETPIQKWMLDMSSGALVNMDRRVAENAIGRIEDMISDEKKKIRGADPEELIAE